MDVPLYVPFLAFIVCALAISLPIAARVTGWRTLSRRYPALDGRSGKRIWPGYAWFRGLGLYTNTVYLKAGATHLHFQMIPPFRVAHPPFSVPWTDISAERQRHWWWSSLVRFSFAGEPAVPFKVLDSVGDRIIAASGGRIQLRTPSAPL